MKKKTILFILIVIFLFLFFLIHYKTKNNGNNINKLIKNIDEYILNISSYEAKIELTIESNKTINKYKLEQLYYKPKLAKQIVKEPLSLENLTFIYDGQNIKVENTRIGLSKIYENYKYVNENALWLSFFVENYNASSKVSETGHEIIIENNKQYSEYNVKQILHIDKKQKIPKKMEIYDNNKKIRIYIKYNEIILNKLDKNKILE